MATRLVTKRCDFWSLGVPGPASTPKANQTKPNQTKPNQPTNQPTNQPNQTKPNQTKPTNQPPNPPGPSRAQESIIACLGLAGFNACCALPWSSNNNRPPSAAGGGCAAAVVVAGPRQGLTSKPAKPRQATMDSWALEGPGGS